MEEPENKIKVLCLGPKGSGKTTLLKKLQDVEEIDNTYSPVPTMGTNIFDLHYLDKAGKKQMMSIREVGGEMAPLWTNYLDGVQKIVYVVDTSNLCQISAAAVQLYTILAEPRLTKAKIILVLTKMDAAYRQMRNEALLMLQLARLRRELRRPLLLLEASGVEGDGVPELRQALTNMRNEALLMLQLARLRRELRRPLLLLEASGVEGDGVPELKQALTNVPAVVG